ncbi:choline ABC transporter permease subunit [Aliiroseovarius sp. Z3]|uniref:choline ABC transporter permease subunit n=1 Tax=Aliiroseovarius sp. Z3 TaxID=2811402 RepID=UPI0023B21F2D|nr:choline ABC transporter permease subunit [Aliiroseovarius sp. Z3]MDE9449960.1 choline ABC transporter permease subunit [Aliiroseovarius sp. Z3]
MEWLESQKIPIGNWARAFVDWLTDNFFWFFDGLSAVLEAIILALLWLLQAPHAFVVIAVITSLSWVVRRSVGFTVFTALGLLLIVNQGYWVETTETLALVFAAAVVCMGVGVPLGIAAARRPWLHRIMEPILDLMQTIPTFVYLIPALPQIMAGLTQTIMLSLSMVVIAALVGADGLGVPTLRALNSVNIAKGFEVGIAIVLVAIIFDRMFKRRST